MLKLYAIVRLALSRSPTREQQEIRFATPSSTSLPPGERPSEGSFGTTPASPSTIEQATQNTHAKAKIILSSLDTQQIFAELEHMNERELFERLLEQEETLTGTDVAAAARKAGIHVTFAQTMPTREFLSKLFTYESDRGITPDAKRKFVHALLEQSPHIAAALSRGLLGRMQDFEDQNRIIEVCRKELGTDGIRQAVQIARNEKSAETRPILINAAKAIRLTENYGARYWGIDGASPDQDDKRRTGYLRSLKEEAQKIAQILNPQIQRSIEEIGSKLETSAVLLRARYPKVPEDVLLKTEGDLIERLKRVARVLESDTAEPPANLEDEAFRKQLRAYIQEREYAAHALDAIRRDAEALIAKRKKEGPVDALRDLRTQDAWVERCLPMILVLLTDPDALEPKTRAHLEGLHARLQDREALAAYDEQEMAREEYMLRTLVERGEKDFLDAESEGKAIEQSVAQEIEGSTLPAWATERQQELKRLEGSLTALLTHPVCAELKINDQLQEYSTQLHDQLDTLKQEKIPADKRREIATRSGAMMAHWRTALERVRALGQATKIPLQSVGNPLVQILDTAAYRDKFHVKTSLACFRDGKIWIRRIPGMGADEIADLVVHEKAHALLDILSNQSHLLPFLVEDAFDELTQEQWQLLEKRREAWGAPSREEVRAEYRGLNPTTPQELLNERADAHYRRLLLNEAAVSGSLAVSGHEDRRLLNRLKPAKNDITAPEFALHETDDDFGVIDDERMMQETPQVQSTAYDAKENLEEIERMLMTIRNFGEAYGTDRKAAGRNYHPQYKQQADEILGNGRGDGGYEDVLDMLRHIHRTGKTRDTGQTVDPAYNIEYRDTVARFKQHVGKTTEKVEKLDQKFSEDIENAPSEQKKTWKELLGIQTLCILDIMRIYKEFKEDIEGMWHSMQDGKTADVKAALTQHLPVNIPGTNIKIPIIGKYTERLPHYTERARNSKELERVKKWEEAFENLDADELLDLIGKTPTKDQLRASIELLVKKGRMAWGDEKVWKALNEKSKYKMPFGPCKANEVIRDKWLHKLVTDVWKDKDMFNEWMTGNSGNYDKHKQSYTHEGDNFSNIAGQMGHELRSMLKTYVECTSADPPKPLPEQVNPHHYELLLDYAMRNGKMRMEDKIFFLIQGIASGFMPIERLRVLSGEKGGILTKFPFLDYFYQRHNTMREIKDLAGRLREKDDPYKPGVKTTLFMRLVVLRDMKVRERMTKASDRKMEEIDHEDVPYLATDVDYEKMKNLLGNVSGERWKVTVQGWKNAYVGFNEKFKMYAHLARMARQGKARFSPQDVSDLAQTVASYVVMDNKLSGAAAIDKEARLSKQNLESEVPVANPTLTTSTYRNRTRDFVGDLVRSVGMTDTDLQTGLTLDQFMASAQRDQQQFFDKAHRTKMIETIDPFAKAIIAKIEDHPDALMDQLIAWEGRSFGSGGKFLDSFTDDDGSSRITSDTIDREYPIMTGAVAAAH